MELRIFIVLIIPAFSLKLNVPNGHVMKPGQTFVMRCTEDRSESVQVERHITGSSWVVIGSDGQLHEPFMSQTRYKMYPEHQGGQSSYVFEIKDVRFEDTAFYRCKLRLQPIMKQTVLAVCDDPDSQECKCIQDKGMNDPICFRDAITVDQMNSKNQQIITGLIVCLVIAIIIAVGFAIVAGLDCSRRMHAKRKRAAANAARESAARQAGRSVYDDTEQLQLDPNDVESTSNPYYNNAGYTADEPVHNTTVSMESRPNGNPSSARKAHSRTPNGTTPGSRGAPSQPTSTRNTPLTNGTSRNAKDALDPRNLSAFQFPTSNNNHDGYSPARTPGYSQPGKSPGDFSLASGDLDMLKTPRDLDAGPSSPYTREYNVEPRRLEFINQPASPYQAADPIEDYSIKPPTVI